MRAEILSVGTELLLGHITDTNASYLAGQLSTLGIDCFWISQVGDNLGRLVAQLQRAWERTDLLVITGGLGPTEDDLTREAISELLAEPMVVQPDLEAHLRAFFARRGVQMPESNVKQAALVASARALPNPIGTAPGWWVERDGHVIIAMPGVPPEMYRMWEEQVLPRLQERQGGTIILSRALKVVGLGESSVEEMIRPLLASTNPTMATYAKADGIHVRMSAKAAGRDSAESMLDELEPKVREILGQAVYGSDNETLASVVATLLERQGLTIASAEEYTGGVIASELSDAAGAHFRGGLVRGAAAGLTPAFGSPSLSEMERGSRAARRADGRPRLKQRSGHHASQRTPAVPGPGAAVAGQVPGGEDGAQRARALAEEAVAHFGAEVGLGVTAIEEQPTATTRGKRTCAALLHEGEVRELSRLDTTASSIIRRRAVLYALNLVREYLLARSVQPEPALVHGRDGATA